MNPFADPFAPGPGASLGNIFARSPAGVARKAAPKPAGSDKDDDDPPVESAPEETPVEKKEAARVVLRNPKWETEDVGFNEETGISVEADLPPEHAAKTRVAFELFAKTPNGPESISKAEGHVDASKASAKIPVYLPAYKDEDGNHPPKVDYYFTAKHTESDLLKDETAIKSIDHFADRYIDSHLLEDVTFQTGKSFPRPAQATSLKGLGAAVKAWREKHSDAKVAVFGHADAVGKEQDNKTLSERRARAIHAFLAKEPKTWEALYGEEKWGLATTQELLAHLGHPPGAIDGVDGPKTQGAVKDFQGKKGLKVDGQAGPDTREALYLAYMEACDSPASKAKEFDSIDGNPHAGCSEFNLAQKTDGACEPNRRVTALLLKSNKNFPIQYPCKQGDISPCRKQADRKGERKHPGFKCLFYDQLVKEEKKGGGGKENPAPVGTLKLAGVKDGEEVKQFINLPAGKPGEGPERLIEATVEGAADGAKVYWKVTAAKENSARNSPKAGLKPDAKGALTEFKDGVAELESEAKAGKASCLLVCGLAGGDKFTVEAGLEKGKAAGHFSVITWRKIYYQLTVPKGLKPDIGKLNTAMTAVHIECEKSDEVEVPLEDGPAGSWVNGEDFGRGTGRKLVVGTQNREHFHKLFKGAKKPIEAHYMFCHFQLDGVKAPKTADLDGDNSSKVTLPGEKTATAGCMLSAKTAFPGFKIFPVDFYTGKAAATVKWASKAASGAHKGKQGTLPADHVIINYKDFEGDGGRIYAKFPADVLAVVGDGAEITLSFTVQVAKGWYNGEADGHLVLIAAGRTKADKTTIDWDGINGTMAHELGHSMKMVAKSNMTIPGIDDVRKAHTRWYDTTRGHQGDHCAKDVPQAAYDDATKKMSDYSGTCVMFGAGVAGRSNNFCDLCTPLLHGVDLSSISK
jgi:outer membrane protein OmpA-like peptidoglycan-associated protein